MALRIERYVPNIYFGRPGSLVTLPYPRGGMVKPYDRLTYDFVTGSGQHAVSQLSAGSRAYAITWNALHVDNYRLIEQFWAGAMGQGPWVILDPSTRNLLMPNQSMATNIYNDARGWSTPAANQGTPVSNSDTTLIHRTGAPRNLRWQFTVSAATTPILSFTYPYRNWPGFPVLPGLSYAFSSWLRADGVIDSSITTGLRIGWMNAAGSQLSESDGGSTGVTATWVQKSCIATAPANAAYAQPRYVATGSSIVTGGSLYIDEPMLEQDSVVNDWAPDTGVRPVMITSLDPDSVSFAARMRDQISLGIRELAV